MSKEKGRIFVFVRQPGADRFGFDLEAGPFSSSDEAEAALKSQSDGTYYIIRVQREVELKTVKARELKRVTFGEFNNKEED